MLNRENKERYHYSDIERLMLLADSAQPAQVSLSVEAQGCYLDADASEMVHLENADPIMAANAASRYAEGVYVHIPKNVVAEGVITIDLNYTDEPSSISFLRNYIKLERGSEAKVVLYHHHCAASDLIINSRLSIELEHGAILEVVEVADTRATLLSAIEIRQHADSRIRVTTIDSHNRVLIRNQHVMLEGSGADCTIGGVYLTSDGEHADNYTKIEHKVPHCTSSQLFKGIAGGASTAAFTGHILVAQDAQQTVALQQNHNIVLSDKAKIYTRPQLEIYADDVKCNHGATVGRLDPEAIYYMRQRGISLEAARRLQLEGFAEDVVRLQGIGELQSIIHQKIARRLSAL